MTGMEKMMIGQAYSFNTDNVSSKCLLFNNSIFLGYIMIDYTEGSNKQYHTQLEEMVLEIMLF